VKKWAEANNIWRSLIHTVNEDTVQSWFPESRFFEVLFPLRRSSVVKVVSTLCA